jgi:hypothetical protein
VEGLNALDVLELGVADMAEGLDRGSDTMKENREEKRLPNTPIL